MVLNKLKNSCDPIEQILEFEEDERILTNVIRLTYLTMSSSIHYVEIKKIEDELVPSIIKYFRDKEDLKPKTHNMVHFRTGEAFHVLCRNDVLRSKNKVEEAKTIARKNAYRECKMKLQDYGASAIKKYIPGKDDIIYLEKNGNSYGYNVIKVIDSDATKVHGFKLSLKHCYGSLFYFSITEEEDFYDCSTILSTECEYHIYKEKNCELYKKLRSKCSNIKRPKRDQDVDSQEEEAVDEDAAIKSGFEKAYEAFGGDIIQIIE
uniref:Tudor domain-containing protein n=1 Tax=Strongyloides papillosus TaxID=174720 RepID=A0A0N5C5G3_STREA